MSSHCIFPDSTGLEVRVRKLTWGETFGGVIEGDLREISREIRERLPRSVRKPSVVFHSGGDKVLPSHSCSALVEADGQKCDLIWFQGNTDPFVTLGRLISEFEWRRNPNEVRFHEPECDLTGPPPASVADPSGIVVKPHSLQWQETHLDHPDPEPKKTFLYVMGDLSRKMRRPNRMIQTNEHRLAFPRREEETEGTGILPPESAIVLLHSDWRSDEEDWYTHLTVCWYQDPGNPLDRLHEVMEEVDWKKEAVGWYP